MERYPQAQIVASMGAFRMMVNYFGTDYPERKMVVKEGDVLDLGGHSLTFVGAPNVHWPEVLFSYESTDKVLFSADGFGKFGANDIEDGRLGLRGASLLLWYRGQVRQVCAGRA